MRYNKVECITTASVYCTTHDVKVPFCMLEFSNSKITYRRFHGDIYKGQLGIGYDMIMGSDLMVQLGLMANFKHQLLQWYGATVHMKDPGILLGPSNLTKSEMSKVMMHNEEPASTREATERMVKILDSAYAKADLEQVVANASQLNAEERNL